MADAPGLNLEEAAFDASLLNPSERADSMGRLEKYDVLAVLGQGTFGVVLKAFDEQLRRSVAIKILSREYSSSATARRRFIREARAAAAVSHPNVVAIHAVDEQPGVPFLVMELLGGGWQPHVGRSGDRTAVGCRQLCRDSNQRPTLQFGGWTDRNYRLLHHLKQRRTMHLDSCDQPATERNLTDSQPLRAANDYRHERLPVGRTK